MAREFWARDVQKKKEKNGRQWVDAQRLKEGSDRVFREWVRILFGRDYSSHSVGVYGVVIKEVGRK